MKKVISIYVKSSKIINEELIVIDSNYEISRKVKDKIANYTIEYKENNYADNTYGIVGKNGSGKSALLNCIGLMSNYDYYDVDIPSYEGIIVDEKSESYKCVVGEMKKEYDENPYIIVNDIINECSYLNMNLSKGKYCNSFLEDISIVHIKSLGTARYQFRYINEKESLFWDESSISRRIKNLTIDSHEKIVLKIRYAENVPYNYILQNSQMRTAEGLFYARYLLSQLFYTDQRDKFKNEYFNTLEEIENFYKEIDGKSTENHKKAIEKYEEIKRFFKKYKKLFKFENDISVKLCIKSLLSLKNEEKIDFLNESKILNKNVAVDPLYFYMQVNHSSTGEEAFSNLFATIEDAINLSCKYSSNCILLLDEPEVFLHPELQRAFIKELLNKLEGYKKDKGKKIDFQIFIATHSPFLITDIFSDNVIALEKGSRVDKENTFAANIYDILSDTFFLEYSIGEYSRLKLVELQDQMKRNECKVTEEQKYIINQIGDKLIQKVLLSKGKTND